MDSIHRGNNVITNQPQKILDFLSHLSLCGYGLLYFLNTVFAFPVTIISTLRFGSVVFAILGGLFCNRPIIRLTRFVKLYAVLIVISFAASSYSINYSAFSNSRYLFETTIIAIVFSSTIINRATIKRFLYMMAFSGTVMFVVLASKNLLYIDDRLGRTLTGGNLNMFAMYVMLTLMACIMLIWTSNKKLEKIILIFIAVLDVYMLMLSGGRKYILTPLIMCAIIMWYDVKNSSFQKKFIMLIFAVLVIYIGWRFMMTNETVYMSIGRRFENQEGAEGRADLIVFGLKKFIGSPIWGYGEDAYEVLLYMDAGIWLYSHNNYIELLVNFGLVGFLWFYGMYFVAIRDIHKKRHVDNMYLVFDAFMISSLFLHTGIVAYNTASLLIQFLAISFMLSEDDSLLEMEERHTRRKL